MAGGPLVRADRWDSVLLLQNLERPEAVKTCGRKKRIVTKIQTMKLAERVGFEALNVEPCSGLHGLVICTENKALILDFGFRPILSMCSEGQFPRRM